MFRLVVILGFVFSSTFGSLAHTLTQTPPDPGQNAALSWSLSPTQISGQSERVSFRFEVAAGQSVNDSITVKNFGTTELTLSLYPGDGLTSTDGDFDIASAPTVSVSTGTWITLAQDQVTLAPGASQEVPFTLQVPSSATPGDHPGGIVAVLSTQTTKADGSKIVADHRIGARVHLRVSGELDPNLKISDAKLKYTQNWNPLAPGSAHLTYRVANTGNVRLGFDSTQVLKSLGVKRVSDATAGADTSRRELLPGESVESSLEIASVPPLFVLKSDLQVTPLPVNEDLSETTLTPVTTTVHATAIPIPQLLGLVVLGGLIGLWVRSRIKYRKLRSELARREKQFVQ